MEECGSPEEVGLSSRALARVVGVAERYLGEAYPGYDLLVYRRGCIALRRASGFSEVYPVRRPLRVEMLFDLASLTKVLSTSIVFAKLVEEGLIGLRQSVVEIAPEFRCTAAGPNALKERIRVWMLLSHSSGLPAWVPLYRYVKNRDEAFSQALSVFPSIEPGFGVIYSDINYIVLTYIAEKISGERIDRLFDKIVAKPLGLSRTLYNPLESGLSRDEIVATESIDWRGGTIVGEVHDENAYSMNGVSGHAGLFSTAGESVRIVAELMRSYRGESDLLVSQASARTFLKKWACGDTCYGLGWQVYEPESPRGYLVDYVVTTMFAHTGFTGTSILFAPALDMAVIFYTNRVHPSRNNDKILSVRPLIHNTALSALKSF